MKDKAIIVLLSVIGLILMVIAVELRFRRITNITANVIRYEEEVGEGNKGKEKNLSPSWIEDLHKEMGLPYGKEKNLLTSQLKSGGTSKIVYYTYAFHFAQLQGDKMRSCVIEQSSDGYSWGCTGWIIMENSGKKEFPKPTQ